MLLCASNSPLSDVLSPISSCSRAMQYMDLPVYQKNPGYAPVTSFLVSWFLRFAVFLLVMQIPPASRFHFFLPALPVMDFSLRPDYEDLPATWQLSLPA